MRVTLDVTYLANGGFVERVVLAGLAGGWLWGLLVWAAVYVRVGQWPPAQWGWAMAAGLGLSAWTIWRLRVASPATMARGGQGWQLFSATWRRGLVLARVDCTIDGQSWMLLRVQSTTGLSQWLWCTQRDDPERWPLFRQAVYQGATGDRV